MINNTSTILSQNILGMEESLTNLLEKVIEQEKNGDISINSAEILIGETLQKVSKIILNVVGNLLSNIVEKDDCKCKTCGKSLSINKKNVDIDIMTIYGPLNIKRDTLFCRLCHVGRGINDQFLEIIGTNTQGITELASYVGQLLGSFDEGEKTIEKFLGFLNVKVSSSKIRDISETIGEVVFDKSIETADKVFENPHKYIESPLEESKKEGNLYIMMDGSHVNTLEKNEKGTTWREMKLGEVFNSNDIIFTKSGQTIITKKEYVTYLGEVGKFKKVVLAGAARGGYGTYKETTVLGDGAVWIWNMTTELFPDAKQILDFYHLSENISAYAKALYPKDEVTRKQWENDLLKLLKSGKQNVAIKKVNECAIKKSDLPAGVVNLPHYLEKNKDRINYKEYIDNGYYIGSGPIESGNKSVIQQRLKQAGMRWHVNGAQYIAALRAKYKSDLWRDVISIIKKPA